MSSESECMVRNHLSYSVPWFYAAQHHQLQPLKTPTQINYLGKTKDHIIPRRKQKDLPTPFYVQDSGPSTKYHGYNLANTVCKHLFNTVI